MKRIEVSNGSKYGRLTVLSELPAANKARRFLCQCDCGNQIERTIKALLKNSISSCGCYQDEFNNSPKTERRSENYGYVGTRLYDIWTGIKKRCKNPNNKAYKWYGGRGIKICIEWDERYLEFHRWSMENGYAENLSIDRKNVDGNYEPGNCRWVLKSFQNNNKRDNRTEIYNGQEMTISQISNETGKPYTTIIGRLNRGLSIEEAVL